jgi:pyruvate dehydrogenase E1 component
VAVAALKALTDEQEIPVQKVSEALQKYQIDPERADPTTV